jgi:hypothetical protein
MVYFQIDRPPDICCILHIASFKSLFHFVVCNYSDQFQINQPTRCNNFSGLLLDVYVQLNMFRASSRPSSGTACGRRPSWPTTTNRLLPPRSNGKTRGYY